MMSQYFQPSYIKVANRSVFGVLFFVGLIAPFTFLKHKVIFDTQTEKSSSQEIISTQTANVGSDKPASKTNVNKPRKKLINEKPLHNVDLPDFANIKSVREKKRRFFEFIKPAIRKHHEQLLQVRSRLVLINEAVLAGDVLDAQDIDFISALASKYHVKSKYSIHSQLNQLMTKVDIVPMPLTLVQAANESAWGTSRFSRVGLNFFGIWCFKKGCGMIPSGRDLDADHEVEAFKTVDDAIRKYTFNINTNGAYRTFRKLRKQQRADKLPLSSEVLASGLIHYSERGSEYVEELIDMIRHNKRYFG
jgi:Bax protein